MTDTALHDPVFGSIILVDENSDADFANWEAQVSLDQFDQTVLVNLYGEVSLIV